MPVREDGLPVLTITFLGLYIRKLIHHMKRLPNTFFITNEGPPARRVPLFLSESRTVEKTTMESQAS